MDNRPVRQKALEWWRGTPFNERISIIVEWKKSTEHTARNWDDSIIAASTQIVEIIWQSLHAQQVPETVEKKGMLDASDYIGVYSKLRETDNMTDSIIALVNRVRDEAIKAAAETVHYERDREAIMAIMVLINKKSSNG